MASRTSALIERQHPLFSPVALISAALLIVGLGVGVYLGGGRAFSPGHLSAASHSGLESGGFANHADFGDTCTRCHAPFKGVQTALCEDCHTAIAAARTAGEGLHGRLLSADCNQCHQEHGGAAINLFQQAVDNFSPAQHDQLIRLEGAHVALACEECHVEERYAGTPTDCHGCHAEPVVHASLFGVDCAACHSAEAWQPARLTRHVFPLDHGDMGQNPCAVCHVETFTAYTCAECHAADEMQAAHAEQALSVQALAQCTDCHPIGQIDEAARSQLATRP